MYYSWQRMLFLIYLISPRRARTAFIFKAKGRHCVIYR